ncbi:MAG: 50S ribosomal protein L17 [Phascolarctobacterium sp.]|nr:MAG: 50S ribosomal protein L17 [Phascolarctobacterium sp.]
MAYRKLGRNSSNRKALFRSILSSFFKHERIETTVTKAKEVSKHAAKLITLAKRGDLHARRLVMAELVDEEATRKLFNEIAPKYADRQGGFTRIYRVGPRRGDAAEMAIIELI